MMLNMYIACCNIVFTFITITYSLQTLYVHVHDLTVVLTGSPSLFYVKLIFVSCND